MSSTSVPTAKETSENAAVRSSSLRTDLPHAHVGDIDGPIRFGTVEGNDALRLVLSGGRVLPHDGIAQTDGLIDEHELIENVRAPFDVVLGDLLLRWMVVGDESIEHRHAVGQTRSTNIDNGRIQSEEDSTCERDGQCGENVSFAPTNL